MSSAGSTATIFLQLSCGGRAVAGDGVAQGYERQIAIERCSWSSGAEHRAIGRDLRTTLWHGQLRLGKRFDRASTALYGHMRNHDRIDSARLTLLDAGAGQGPAQTLAELQLVDCFIDAIATRASDAGVAMQVDEDIALSFASGLLRYYPLSQPGAIRSAPTEYRIPPSRTHG